MGERIFQGAANFDELAEILTGRISGAKRLFPFLTNLAQVFNGFFRAQVGAPAINALYLAPFQLSYGEADGMQIRGNKPNEGAPHEEIKASNRHQRRGTEVHIAGADFELAHLVERALLQQLTQTSYAIETVGGLLERLLPLRWMQSYLAHHRLEHLRNLFESHALVVECGRRAGR